VQLTPSRSLDRLTLLVLAALVGACNPPPPSAPPRDAFRADGGPRDAAVVDGAAMDGSDADLDGGGNVDADIDADVDAFRVDAAPEDAHVEPEDANLDAGPPPDSSACVLPDGGFDVCACETFGADCSASACPLGQTCGTDVCGMHCVAAGAPCAAASDCAATSTCDASGHCTHPGGGCADSRDCAAGHACEAAACVDRLIPCEPTEGACPFGFACSFAGVPFCARLTRPCASSVGCGSLECVDIDGNGTTECNFAGSCDTNMDCPAAGDVCQPRSIERYASCGRYGPCRVVADCASGMLCQDLWGDGISECVDAGGSCARSADCPVGSVCATPATGGPPACLVGG
jgi:hypothetical protein